ncbi:MAG: hypothetical protein A2504_01720 [Bdellovibrionales bacterium RIFOXYD12_FULL_39_22]|nr:MAG: hypothetical protein A2385_04245 [Bdellovibrionales bacterium RIFOXYB1_FULL_39_21]OFZ42376.1 MAG: hypothetical protein A2485_15250 [Bdellovibrionales bacterium RIFOXYC12_FULL_39_17]OFZ46323.1 MAG: hypothetical protein A2404_13765 [Bdellovibrionales bacterium RIFOXYC1_FULL_39_130]OFZ75216.1 MAG: hypothetical protein A2560_15820 [Bdellovibrionales bacterium RIFOXYD1_FULL_39_84]OFZ93210.1 MAG: hypothetical protein A2504_01720 [Bdellovibrionales bacterium RIFOXYD12_FULL_39_22]HLE11079.1 hy
MRRITIFSLFFSFFIMATSYALVVADANDTGDFEVSVRDYHLVSKGLAIELREMNLPAEFVEKTLLRLGGFVFKNMPAENIGGYYNKLTKKIYLPLSMYDTATNSLKAVSALTLDDLSTLYHELWHAYLDLIARSDDLSVYTIWFEGAGKLYNGHGRDIHDEAYGLFVGELAMSYSRTWRSFIGKTLEGRERLRSSPQLKGLYEQTFKEKIFGYYRRWDGVFVDSTVNLPEVDRYNITDNLFRKVMSRDYVTAYREEIFAINNQEAL